MSLTFASRSRRVLLPLALAGSTFALSTLGLSSLGSASANGNGGNGECPAGTTASIKFDSQLTAGTKVEGAFSATVSDVKAGFASFDYEASAGLLQVIVKGSDANYTLTALTGNDVVGPVNNGGTAGVSNVTFCFGVVTTSTASPSPSASASVSTSPSPSASASVSPGASASPSAPGIVIGGTTRDGSTPDATMTLPAPVVPTVIVEQPRSSTPDTTPAAPTLIGGEEISVATPDPLVVNAAAAAGALPRTGLTTDGLLVSGALALAAGFVMVVAGRRRTADEV